MEPPKGTPPMESLPLNTAPVPVEAVLRPDDDAPFVARAQSGDMAAFEVLVERHGRRVYRMILGITGNESDAEDGVQNTFLKAYQNVGEFQGNSKFSSWLLRIAMNEGLEVLRRRRSKFNQNLDEWDAGDEETFRPRSVRPWEENPERQYTQAETRAIVEREIMKLPAKYRVVVMLRDLEQLNTQEAAAALGLNVATLKTRLLRGRLLLREALAPHFRQGKPGIRAPVEQEGGRD
jgi:RNA polymerase sigma-70 factor (ECF subfamily)